MGKKILISYLFFQSFLGFTKTQENKAYDTIFYFYHHLLMDSYTAIMESDLFTKELSQIPAKEKKPYVLFLFHQFYGSRVVVVNTTELYKNHFAELNNLFFLFKPFLESHSFEEFSKHYELQQQKNGQFRLRNKFEDIHTSLVIHYDKIGKIDQIDLYSHEKFQAILTVNYQKVLQGKYVFKSIVKKENRKTITLYFGHYHLNARLTEKDFLG